MHRAAAVALLALLLPAALSVPAARAAPEGVWAIDTEVAVQIFDCGPELCGRIVWLLDSHDLDGLLNSDKRNPDASLRKQQLCGLTILGGLRRDGPGRWASGWFYNPQDGKTYSVKADIESPDVITARIYAGIPLFGRTKTLLRIPRLSSEGWC
jgi:uncharacterized protein (DUF2147 family)